MLIIASGTLACSSDVKYVKNELLTPKHKNSSAGKQQVVDKIAVIIAPKIRATLFFI